MTEHEYELRPPSSEEEWREFHNIRRKVLFENRGKGDSYIENHPDDLLSSNHPLVFLYEGTVIGVSRLDTCEGVIWLRRVAIREDLQRLGHGRVLLRLSEQFGVKHGCREIRTNSAVEAVGFYERCGYKQDNSSEAPMNSVAMFKKLS